MKKAIAIIIILSVVACNTSLVIFKGDKNEINQRQKMDSLQLIKNDSKLPTRWK